VIATIPIAGILVAAALLSGFSSMIGNETAIAQQQNVTGTNVTAGNVTAGNVTAGNVTAGNVTAGNVTGNQTATDIRTGATGPASECDPSYPDVCIRPPPPNLNCDDEGVPENFGVSGSDPHGFDGDNDGIGCES
jgi:hypothetical protein